MLQSATLSVKPLLPPHPQPSNLLRELQNLETSRGYRPLTLKHPWLEKKIPILCGCRNVVAPTALAGLLHILDSHVGRDWTFGRLENVLRFLGLLFSGSARPSNASKLVH